MVSRLIAEKVKVPRDDTSGEFRRVEFSFESMSRAGEARAARLKALEVPFFEPRPRGRDAGHRRFDAKLISAEGAGANSEAKTLRFESKEPGGIERG
jgi:hypothetical protein